MGTEVRLQVMQLLLSAHPEDLVVTEVQKICGDLTNVILPASRHRRVAWLIFVSEQPLPSTKIESSLLTPLSRSLILPSSWLRFHKGIGIIITTLPTCQRRSIP